MSVQENLYDRNVREFKMGKLFPKYIREHKLVYLKYIEIPITTRCTLNCRECCNLIQYYSKPYTIECENLLSDIHRLCSITSKIKMMRLLGGEPLLHPQLADILRALIKENKIMHIQVVTNGTLLFSDDILKVLKNRKISVDISNYEEMSKNYFKLINQLKENNIVYYTQKERIKWTKSADFRNRRRDMHDMEKVYSQCDMDCISLLNGQIHLCARSAHGMDLGIINDCKEDYVDLRDGFIPYNAHINLFKLLNKKYISACNYCDLYRWKELEEVVAGEQISKQDSREFFKEQLSFKR